MVKNFIPTLNEQKVVNARLKSGVKSGYLDDLKKDTLDSAIQDDGDTFADNLGATYVLGLPNIVSSNGYLNFLYLDLDGNLLDIVEVDPQEYYYSY